MFWMVFMMLVCLALAAVVVGYVARDARRDGRDVFTPEGEELLATVKRGSDVVVDAGSRLGKRAVETVGRR